MEKLIIEEQRRLSSLVFSDPEVRTLSLAKG